MKKLLIVTLAVLVIGCNNNEPLPAFVNYSEYSMPMAELPILHFNVDSPKGEIMHFDALTSDWYGDMS